MNKILIILFLLILLLIVPLVPRKIKIIELPKVGGIDTTYCEEIGVPYE